MPLATRPIGNSCHWQLITLATHAVSNSCNGQLMPLATHPLASYAFISNSRLWQLMALAIHAVAPYATGNSCQEMAGVANTHWRLIVLCDTSR